MHQESPTEKRIAFLTQVYNAAVFVLGLYAIAYIGMVREEYAAIMTAIIFVPLSLLSVWSLKPRSLTEIGVLWAQLIIAIAIGMIAGGNALAQLAIVGMYPLIIQIGALTAYFVAGLVAVAQEKNTLWQRVLLVGGYVVLVFGVVYLLLMRAPLEFSRTAVQFYAEQQGITALGVKEMVLIVFALFAVYENARGLKKLS